MRVFVRVVEVGTFTGAAASMGVTTTYASRAISELETHLQAKLLNRTTRRLALTDTGKRYLERCRQIIDTLDHAEAEARDAFVRPSGKLRVHAMGSFSRRYIVPLVAQYQQRYPEVQIELTLTQRVPDLLEEGYDVSLVVSTGLASSGLIVQRLGSAFNILCASPAYLQRRGVPATPGDLAHHTCLQIESTVYPSSVWSLQGDDGAEQVELGQSVFKVNMAEALAVAIREGMGIGLLPGYTAMDGLESGELVRVLPQYVSQEMDIHALYASREYLDAKIRTWVDFLRAEMPRLLTDDAAKLRSRWVAPAIRWPDAAQLNPHSLALMERVGKS